ncbi:hypothetical protein ACFWBX_31195 [Streptomyces sp. NPDC059991]|uniref:hypothetical protein n=1 Tax=Streptomyces sp. NPDC059991 TaxID=3347028 RepID=UPI0036B153C6
MPACVAFEATASAELARRAAVGTLEIAYVLAFFLDRTLGGGGSDRAVNALRVAVDAGLFPAYRGCLRLPAQDADHGRFPPDFLLAVADQVPGPRVATFDRGIRTNTDAAWAAACAPAPAPRRGGAARPLCGGSSASSGPAPPSLVRAAD